MMILNVDRYVLYATDGQPSIWLVAIKYNDKCEPTKWIITNMPSNPSRSYMNMDDGDFGYTGDESDFEGNAFDNAALAINKFNELLKFHNENPKNNW